MRRISPLSNLGEGLGQEQGDTRVDPKAAMRLLAPALSRQAVQPRLPRPPKRDVFICPRCSCELSEGVHGWVRILFPHECNESHSKHFDHCIYPCPDCTGDAQQQALVRKQAKMVQNLFGRSQIPFYAQDWTFETFPHDADQAALQVTRDFLADFKRGSSAPKRGLYIGGDLGRGKTGLALSLLKEVIRLGQLGLFVPAVEVMQRIRASYRKESETHTDELLETVTTVPWLVLDDLAVEPPTRHTFEQFYYIIEKRRSSGLYTVFTSNLNTKALEKYWRPTDVKEGEFHAGKRILDRILDYCIGIAVNGRNLRGGL